MTRLWAPASEEKTSDETDPANVAVAVSLTFLAAAPSANAADFRCTSPDPIGIGQTFDNVVVPPGATCFLTRATVRGNITASARSTLRTVSNVVRGSVLTDGADTASLLFDDVRGSIAIKKSRNGASDFDVQVCGATVAGSIQAEENDGDTLLIGGGVLTGCPGNVVGGNVDVLKNRVNSYLDFAGNRVAGNVNVIANFGPGLKSVLGNTVRQTLLCKENAPPFQAAGNTAAKAEGQCAAP